VGVRGRTPLPEEQRRAPACDPAPPQIWQRASGCNYHALHILSCDITCGQFMSAVTMHTSCRSCCLLQGGLEPLRAPFLPTLRGCSTPARSPKGKQNNHSLNVVLFDSLRWAPEKVPLPFPPKLDSECMASWYLFDFCSEGSCCTAKDAIWHFTFIRK